MASLPPSGSVPPLEPIGVQTLQTDAYTLQAASQRRPWLRFVLAGIVLLLLGLMLLVALLPSWRTTVSDWLAHLSFIESTETATDSSTITQGANSLSLSALPLTVSQPLTQSATTTPTPQPAPAISLLESADSPRWQIAYPDAARGPGLGCAYFSFRLSGEDAADLALLDELDVEMTIFDGEFVFERYGPLPLAELRSLGDSNYYELPGSGPECTRHRFAEPAEYRGMEFRLSLLAGDMPVRVFRYGLTEAVTFATITPTPPPATITPTAFPQIRVREAVNVRSGPGTVYTILGSAGKDDVYAAIASDGARNWWQIDYQGQIGWIYAPLVDAVAVDGIGIAQVIPPTPVPLPTQPPTPTPAPPTPAPTPYHPFLLSSVGVCEPNAAMTFFEGRVLSREGAPLQGACVHIAYDEPRQTKCTGCDGNTEGKWGFAPFGNLPGKAGVTVRIYVVPCPESGMTGAGQDAETGFGPLTPVSPVWTYTVGESVQCTGIVFQDNRFFDDDGNQIPPPAPTLAPSPNQLFSFQGEGQTFTDPFVLEAGQVRFRATLSGQGTYSLQVLSSIGRNIDLLASGVGPADVDKTITIPSNGTYFVNVSTDGPWTILIEKP